MGFTFSKETSQGIDGASHEILNDTNIGYCIAFQANRTTHGKFHWTTRGTYHMRVSHGKPHGKSHGIHETYYCLMEPVTSHEKSHEIPGGGILERSEFLWDLLLNSIGLPIGGDKAHGMSHGMRGAPHG